MSNVDGGAESSEAHRLVFAMCHEISNLVAAVRLQAHLLDDELSLRELALASLEIDDLSARASAMLQLVKPVLGGARPGFEPVGADVIVHSLEQAIEDYGVGGVKVTIDAPADLPVVSLDPDVIHHLLLMQIFSAIEDAEPGPLIRVCVEVTDAEVVFAIEDATEIEDEHLRWQHASLRGRALGCAVAQFVLHARGGRLEVKRDGGGSRTELRAPRAFP